MSIFSRIFKIGQAHSNKIIDNLEKPEVMLEQAIRDKEKIIRVAREKVQSVIATERQNCAQISKEEKEKIKWDERATYALENNNEKLATQALQRSEQNQEHINSLTPTWNLQRDSINHLKIDLQKMQDELNELKRNKDLIIAQSKTAEVRKAIYEAKASIGGDDTSNLIARMKNKAEKQLYEAEAAQELSENLSKEDSLEKQFQQLGGSTNTKIQARLEAMKKQIQNKK
jgi:phage shock protein A